MLYPIKYNQSLLETNKILVQWRSYTSNLINNRPDLENVLDLFVMTTQTKNNHTNIYLDTNNSAIEEYVELDISYWAGFVIGGFENHLNQFENDSNNH